MLEPVLLGRLTTSFQFLRTIPVEIAQKQWSWAEPIAFGAVLASHSSLLECTSSVLHCQILLHVPIWHKAHQSCTLYAVPNTSTRQKEWAQVLSCQFHSKAALHNCYSLKQVVMVSVAIPEVTPYIPCAWGDGVMGSRGTPVSGMWYGWVMWVWGGGAMGGNDSMLCVWDDGVMGGWSWPTLVSGVWYDWLIWVWGGGAMGSGDWVMGSKGDPQLCVSVRIVA